MKKKCSKTNCLILPNKHRINQFNVALTTFPKLSCHQTVSCKNRPIVSIAIQMI